MTRSSSYPLRCCAFGCDTVAENRQQLTERMYRFVLRKPNGGRRSKKIVRQYEKRFQLWLQALRQRPEDAKSKWVCFKHFVRGSPAPHGNHMDVDWIPTLNLKPKWLDNDRSPTPAATVNSDVHPPDFNEEAFFEREKAIEEPPKPDVESPYCRLCLQRSLRMRPLFPTPHNEENDLLRLTKEIAGIQLEFEVDYNSFMCLECQAKLEEFYNFRELWQSNDALLRTLRNQTRRASPIPIVYIPIERLLHEQEGVNEQPPVDEAIAVADADIPPEVKTETLTFEEPRLNEPEEAAPAMTEATPAAELSTMEMQSSRLEEAPATPPPPAQNNDGQPLQTTSEEVIDVDATEDEKEEMIRAIMKKVRRETLSPKKRKSAGSVSNSQKKSKQKKSLENQHVTNKEEIDKG